VNGAAFVENLSDKDSTSDRYCDVCSPLCNIMLPSTNISEFAFRKRIINFLSCCVLFSLFDSNLYRYIVTVAIMKASK
jgi:hypothetical protein